ncbi:hypothetical protein [Alteromonas sp. H39]|uniref:hypothetical protein n=1 Tax=Alteromonas sp. H39 TaxID=3389876 RepID=UPI0039E1C13E
MERYFWVATGLIVVMSLISGYDNPINVSNMIELSLWCAAVPAIFTGLFQSTEPVKQKARFIWGTNFILSAAFTLVILSMTTYAVIADGPLNESALIFMVMPFGFIGSFIVATPLGFLAYAISKDI